MKLLTILGGIFGLALLGWAYLHFIHDPQLLKRAQADASRDSLTVALAQFRKDSIAHAALDKQRRDSIGVLLKLAAKPLPHPKTDSAVILADSLETLARAHYQDSLAVAAALDAKDSLIAAERADHVADVETVRANLLGVIQLQVQQIETRDADIAALNLALAEAIRQRDEYRKIASPSLVKRILQDLPIIAVTAASGFIAGVVLVP